MNIKWLVSIIGMLLSINLHADGYYLQSTSEDQPWSITASFGKGKYQYVHHHDGQTAIARLALGNELMLTGDFALGLEMGLQNGNHMRLNIPPQTLAVLGWLPVQTSLGPMLDLLVTAKSDPLYGSAFFAQFKGGIAYRHWRIKQEQISPLSQLATEIQAGFGYPITALASLNLLYQGVFGDAPNAYINPFMKTARVSSIPPLHAVLLGFSVNL